jgi:alkanesulfonate monooxygenase SsuD/methylene tetrahydromethanopterin reductase-like flavin-dependent oxidoreductase (luciferase family)
VEFARTRPHPKKLLAAMPQTLMPAIGLVGTQTEISSRLKEYEMAGADEVCLVPATAGDDGGLRTLSSLASLLS